MIRKSVIRYTAVFLISFTAGAWANPLLKIPVGACGERKAIYNSLEKLFAYLVFTTERDGKFYEVHEARGGRLFVFRTNPAKDGRFCLVARSDVGYDKIGRPA